MNIGIIGLGLIGGSLAKSIKQHSSHTVWGYDIDSNVITKALMCGAMDDELNDERLAQCGIVLVALYPERCVRYISENADKFAPNTLVVDCAGVKRSVYGPVSEVAKGRSWTYIGGHPMAGKERNGFDVSDAHLFRGASYILVPCGAPQEAVDTVRQLAFSMGFGSVTLANPAHHDRMIAYTSQLPHVLACAYVLSPSCEQHVGFSAGSYHDVSRVARINEVMWTELFLENREPLLAELDLLLDNLKDFRDAIHREDGDTLRRIMKQSRLTKEKLGE